MPLHVPDIKNDFENLRGEAWMEARYNNYRSGHYLSWEEASSKTEYEPIYQTMRRLPCFRAQFSIPTVDDMQKLGTATARLFMPEKTQSAARKRLGVWGKMTSGKTEFSQSLLDQLQEKMGCHSRTLTDRAIEYNMNAAGIILHIDAAGIYKLPVRDKDGFDVIEHPEQGDDVPYDCFAHIDTIVPGNGDFYKALEQNIPMTRIVTILADDEFASAPAFGEFLNDVESLRFNI